MFRLSDEIKIGRKNVVVAAVIEWRWAAGKSIVRSWSVAGRGRGAVDGVDVADHHGGCRHCPLTLQYCQ